MIRTGRLPALAVLAAAAVALAATGCRERTASREAVAPETLTVSGSGTTIPILETLAKAWEAKHPEVDFNFLPSSHTAGGLEGANTGFLDLGALSRGILPAEHYDNIEAVFFANDVLVFVAHPSSGARNLSKAALLDIYRGRISDWEKVGGQPGKIVVLGRPDHTSAKIALDELLFGAGFPFTPELVMIERAEDVMTAAASTERSLGYTSLGGIVSGKVPVTVMSVDDVAPDEESVRSGRYPYIRPLGVAVKKDAPAHVRDFVDFLRGEEAVKIIREAGFVPD